MGVQKDGHNPFAKKSAGSFRRAIRSAILTASVVATAVHSASAYRVVDQGSDSFLSPTALVAAHDGQSLFVACASAERVLQLDLQTRKFISTFKVAAPPSGLAMSRDGLKLFVTCAVPESWICVIDLTNGRIVDRIRAGHTAMAPVITPAIAPLPPRLLPQSKLGLGLAVHL